ncbi:hypothetical protein [uncultured Maricaulis sp.]|uniref:hypothetical protein n=1 Tax=uncultured Maricaulis sp. TaxID=174710 RepID=UPI0030DAA27C|tara:strand:+ start:8565 stop:9212 length:648 start_codon:yes stop_codon:yes gene_type:complete
MTASTPSDVRAIELYSHGAETFVAAECWHGIVDKNLADWEAEWLPDLQNRLKLLNQRGVERRFWPQSRHWDWRVKLRDIEKRLANRSFALVCEGMTQAMMTVDLTKRARLAGQQTQHLVYIDYIEAAPWNRNDLLGAPPRYRGCGTELILAAIELSIAEGYKGRVGLHSLPQANRFYANHCGMEDLGQDAAYEDLRYFELSSEQAQKFIGKGQGE